LEKIFIPENVTSIGNNIFEDCISLVTVFYQGCTIMRDYDHSHAFDGCDALENVCVTPCYTGSYFCNEPVTSNTPVCQSFREVSNFCFEAEFVDDTIVSHKRQNATEWENQADPCLEHLCDNNEGKSATSKCQSTSEICLMDQCVKLSSIGDENATVRLTMKDGFRLVKFNQTEVFYYMRILCGLESDEMTVGWQSDNQGKNIRFIFIYVEQSKAESTASIVNAQYKGDFCRDGFICDVDVAEVVDSNTQSNSVVPVSGASTNHKTIISITIIMMFLFWMTF